ncbi:unnamed protein product [Pedinophyceae sp. YPF-701]|nr:unnamed protein product [Pedinophyceae sp. YPF-701]
MWEVTDDQGVLCSIDDVDWTTRCCAAGKGQRHSCDACGDHDQCCSTYESCVSCCMGHPEGEAHRQEEPRIIDHPETGYAADLFSFCAMRCRTHKASTSHENTYVGGRHHCFSRIARPLSNPQGFPAGVVPARALQGQTCEAACRDAKAGACTKAAMKAVSNCDGLLSVFPCEAGCFEGKGARFSTYAAPNSRTPHACLGASEPADDCSLAVPEAAAVCGCQKS